MRDGCSSSVVGRSPSSARTIVTFTVGSIAYAAFLSLLPLLLLLFIVLVSARQ